MTTTKRATYRAIATDAGKLRGMIVTREGTPGNMPVVDQQWTEDRWPDTPKGYRAAAAWMQEVNSTLA